MTFERFCDAIKNSVGDYLPTSLQYKDIELMKVIKANDTELTGLCVWLKDGLSPTIYLEDFYTAYEADEITMDEALGRIATIVYEDSKADRNIQRIIDNFGDFNLVKGKLLPRVINSDNNEMYLKDHPSTNKGDLTVVYYLDLGGDEKGGRMSIVITNDILNHWGVSIDEIDKKAMENFNANSKTTVKTMLDTMIEMMGLETLKEAIGEEAIWEMKNNPDQLIISNESKINGATNLLDTDALDKVAKGYGDFYILPSSVHECILLRKDAMREDVGIDDLRQMVAVVNETKVAPNERLSYDVFEYDKYSKTIVKAKDDALTFTKEDANVDKHKANGFIKA